MKMRFRRTILIFTIFFILLSVNVNAQTQYFTGKKSEHTRKDEYLSGITEEMCTSEYWKDKNFIDINQILMDSSEIDDLNKDIVDGSGTMVFDLETMQESYDADSRKQSLSNTEIPTRDLYVDGQKINNQDYFTKLKQAILNTGYSGEQLVRYGICTNRADLKSWPTDDQIGYSATDKDDEMQSSAMNINEPFLIKAKCEIDGKIFYWGNSTNCTGWANAENIAICETKDEWLSYWKVSTNEDNFVTVIGSRIILENSGSEKVEAMLGSIFKLVPDAEIPTDLLNQKDNNYIVYFAQNDTEGKAEKQFAILNKDLELSKGFLPLNQNNILDVAFSCIGDEYGWGGMNGNMDCSLYTRSIYKCFGVELPRNTTWQQKVPGKYVDVSSMGTEEKKNYLSTLPSGSLFYISGHTMVYIGIDKDKNFVVSDLGTVVDEEGEIIVKDVYAVTVNSLNVRRAAGTTWLENIVGVISFMDPIDINDCEIKIEDVKNVYDGTEKKPKIELTYNDKVIYENSNYNVNYINNIEIGTATIEISGINNFTGRLVKTFEIEKEPEDTDENQNENQGGGETPDQNEAQEGNENQGGNGNQSGSGEQSGNENQNGSVIENPSEEDNNKSNSNSNELQKDKLQQEASVKENTPNKMVDNLVKGSLPYTGNISMPSFLKIIVAILVIAKVYMVICKREYKKK